MIDAEDSSDEEEDSSEDIPDAGEIARDGAVEMKGDADIKGSESGSWCSDVDILNRSLGSDGDEALDSTNYLRYASDKFNQKFDIL